MSCRLYLLVILAFLFAGGAWASGAGVRTDASRESTELPLYLLTYDHGGLVLWGRDHFVKYLHSAADWLDRDPVSGFVHEDKLRFKIFPSLGERAVGVRDLPFAVSETTDPYVNGLYWTAVADGDKGIAVFNRGTMGAVREKDGGFSIPLAYAAYYIWGTRMLTGDFEYEFALYPFTDKWADADLHRHAMEYNFPPVGVAAPSAEGSLGGTFQPVSVRSSGAMVSAFYSRNGRTYVRAYEYRGTGGEVSLGRARATEVDLAGRDLGALTQIFPIKPWEITTVRLERSIE